jgi:hypothetical protein
VDLDAAVAQYGAAAAADADTVELNNAVCHRC